MAPSQRDSLATSPPPRPRLRSFPSLASPYTLPTKPLAVIPTYGGREGVAKSKAGSAHLRIVLGPIWSGFFGALLRCFLRFLRGSSSEAKGHFTTARHFFSFACWIDVVGGTTARGGGWRRGDGDARFLGGPCNLGRAGRRNKVFFLTDSFVCKVIGCRKWERGDWRRRRAEQTISWGGSLEQQLEGGRRELS